MTLGVLASGAELLACFAVAPLGQLRNPAGAAVRCVSLVGCFAVMALANSLEAQVSRADSVDARRVARTAIRMYRDSARYISDAPTVFDHARRVCQGRVVLAVCAQDSWGEMAGAGPGGMTVTELRLLQRLTGQLRELSARSPNDAWITEMHARFLARAGDLSAAELVVRATCKDSDWWCNAKSGWITHLQKRIPESEAFFNKALAGMPRDQRCLWDNLGMLMPSVPMAERYERMSCDAREAVNERMWWLSDPLLTVAGNDRRTEHFARWVNIELTRSEARTVFDVDMPMQVSGYLPQAALRRNFAWCVLTTVENAHGCARYIPIGFTVHVSRSFMPFELDGASPFTVGILDSTLHAMRIRELPSARANPTSRDTARLMPGAYRGGYPNLATESHMPYDGSHVNLQNAQVAFMRNGAAAVLLLAFDPRVDTLRTEPLKVAVALSRSPRDTTRVFVLPYTGDAAVRDSVSAALDSVIVSLEARDVGVASAVHRFGVIPSIGANADRVASSELMLYSADGGLLPESRTDALRAMLPRTRLKEGETVGLYWEVYGLRDAERPEFELSVTRISDNGILGAVTQVLGLRSRDGVISARWTGAANTGTAASDGDGYPGALVVNLNTLRAGRYNVVLSTTVAGQAPVTARKLVEVVER